MMDEMGNENWLQDVSESLAEKIDPGEGHLLTPLERLIKCLWAADYCMWNAGDLVQVNLLRADWQTDGLSSALAL